MRALKLILTFLMICSFFYATTQTPNAVKDVERLIILYENESDPKKKLDLSSQIIQLSIYKSRWDLMKKYAIDMQGLAMQSQDKEKEIFALLNLGKAQFFDSKYTEAIESYEIGLEISTRERIQTYVRDLYKELGNVCFQVENFDGALTYNLRAHELAKAKNFQNTMSYTSTLFGDLYMELGQNDKALTRYKEARTYSINTSDSFKIAKDACVLAEFFTKLNKLDTASTFIEEGWNYFGEERKDEVRSRLMKAEVDWCFKKGQYDLALEKALKRHELLVRLKMGKDQVFCAIDIAKTYEKMDELQLGIKYSQLALKKAKKLNENRGMEGCYRILAKLFERQQKYDDAYLAQKQWLSLRDSISHGKLLRLFKDKEIQIAITEQKIEDQLLLERETQRNQKLYRSLIALVIFAFLLGIGGFVFYRLNKRNVQTSERLSSANNLLQLKTVALKKSKTSLQEFSYSFSHDILVQLDRILSLSNMNRQGNQKESFDSVTQLNKVYTTGSSLKKFCLDLIDYFELSQHNKDLDEIDLNEIVDVVIKGLNDEDRNVIDFQIAQLPAVFGNEKQISRVFFNLLSNAIKYKRKEVPLIIKIDQKETNESYIISVTDNGIGIDSDQLQEIFTPFSRLDYSIAGSGLGLSICRRTMEYIDGKIWAESKMGEGMTFYLDFPK